MSTGTWPLGQYAGVNAATLPQPRVEAAVAPSFDSLYEENVDFVWRSARRMGIPDANVEDVVQDVFIVVLRQLPDYDPSRATAKSWLYGIVGRVVHDYKRRFHRKESRVSPLDEQGADRFPSSHPPPSRAAEQAEELRLLEALLASLSPEKREVLVLSQLEEMAVPEIAACLGANVNTIYARLRAARRDFDEALARHRRQP